MTASCWCYCLDESPNVLELHKKEKYGTIIKYKNSADGIETTFPLWNILPYLSCHARPNRSWISHPCPQSHLFHLAGVARYRDRWLWRCMMFTYTILFPYPLLNFLNIIVLVLDIWILDPCHLTIYYSKGVRDGWVAPICKDGDVHWKFLNTP